MPRFTHLQVIVVPLVASLTNSVLLNTLPTQPIVYYWSKNLGARRRAAILLYHTMFRVFCVFEHIAKIIILSHVYI